MSQKKSAALQLQFLISYSNLLQLSHFDVMPEHKLNELILVGMRRRLAERHRLRDQRDLDMQHALALQ